MAHALDTGWVMRGESGIYVSDGGLCNEATRVGIPALTFEIGEVGRLEEDSVATGARCVLNLLRFLNMIDADIKKPVTTQVMREFLGLRARCGGLLITEAELREALRSGDVLCRIIDIFSEEAECVIAPADGLFVRATTLSTVLGGAQLPGKHQLKRRPLRMWPEQLYMRQRDADRVADR